MQVLRSGPAKLEWPMKVECGGCQSEMRVGSDDASIERNGFEGEATVFTDCPVCGCVCSVRVLIPE